ncbi:hypothetical protein LXA43DRAFT_986727 [Ganoderma leucocontextum]|nr:hypothetical protein LXA43DRAFT_986727 [Ganoderma leucocontextum]
MEMVNMVSSSSAVIPAYRLRAEWFRTLTFIPELCSHATPRIAASRSAGNGSQAVYCPQPCVCTFQESCNSIRSFVLRSHEKAVSHSDDLASPPHSPAFAVRPKILRYFHRSSTESSRPLEIASSNLLAVRLSWSHKWEVIMNTDSGVDSTSTKVPVEPTPGETMPAAVLRRRTPTTGSILAGMSAARSCTTASWFPPHR